MKYNSHGGKKKLQRGDRIKLASAPVSSLLLVVQSLFFFFFVPQISDSDVSRATFGVYTEALGSKLDLATFSSPMLYFGVYKSDETIPEAKLMAGGLGE